jgi:hypothetical protein
MGQQTIIIFVLNTVASSVFTIEEVSILRKHGRQRNTKEQLKSEG